jgi:arylsulfatase A
LGCYGHPSIRTPNMDKMAAEGQRWTNFYAAANVCTPSRAALLTGRLPVRNGMDTDKRRVFFPDSKGGLPTSEITIARLLKKEGYKTAAVGKWHLGHLPEFLPTSHGFDSYYGIPYSNDMNPTTDLGHYKSNMDPKIEYFNVPLMRDTVIIERPANQHTITKRYTEEALKFIKENKDDPFFLYLAHNMPHVPLFASEEFEGRSKRGLYGDVVEELDWSVGQILDYLRNEGLDKNTLVVFTSDNGPWTVLDKHGGSAGPLFGAKATSYEGGMREPAIFWWPETIEPAVVMDMGSTLDLLPTISNLADIPLPDDRIYDGYDLSPVLTDGAESPRKEMFYYHGIRLFAARRGDYKLYYYQNNPKGYPERLKKLEKYELYNIQQDPSERFNLAEQYPGIIEEIEAMVDEHKADMQPVESQLDIRI